MSGSSVRRITEGFGEQLVQHRQAEAQRASAITWVGESPRERRVALQDPVQGQGNLSSDGTMLLIRGEGWKEVKLMTISRVTLLEAGDEQRRRAQREGKRKDGVVVRLSQHSYCAGLWDADGFCTYQYAEGLRRGLDLVQPLSSVNDGALWIERVTQTNFPQAVQIIDWSHALQRLWGVANTVYGEGPRAAHWVEHREKALWDGKVEQVIKALDDLDLEQPGYPDLVRQAPGYFRNNRERMRYDLFRAAGYPIGSGTVESGAKNVVQHRMRRPGRGWNRDTGQAMLTPLCELYSGRFQSAWNRVGQRPPSHPKS
jgi:hypothetical protein